MNSASALFDPGKLAEIIASEETRIRLQDQTAPAYPLTLQIPLGQVNITAWLNSLSTPLRYYWSNRDRTFEYGGCGDVMEHFNWRETTLSKRLDELQLYLRHADRNGQLRAFVGEVFDPSMPPDDTWREFPGQCIHLPEICIIREGSQTNAFITMFLDPVIDQQIYINRILALARTLENYDDLQGCDFDLSERLDTPVREEWRRAVNKSIDAISTGQIDKIVLARRSDFRLANSPNPIGVLDCLAECAAGCYRILYSPSREKAFLSLSPERLFLCNGRLLSTEAVAGTIRRGTSEIEDLALENRLRTNAKDRVEQSIVVEGITSSLEPLCEKIEFSSTASVMKLARVQHLISEFRAILNSKATIGEALTALHPTAAVCGNPQLAALELLRNVEAFSRGWYASAIGVVGGDHCEFAVGIRSAVIRGNSVSLFTGAGIVGQSDPEAEWQELEVKLQSVLPGGNGLIV